MLNFCAVSQCWVINAVTGFGGCVEREVAGAAKDGLGRAGVSGLNKRMGREIFSGPGRVSAGNG